METDQSRSKAPEVLQTFDYEDVRLLPGPFLSQVDRAREVCVSISNDDILKGFRSAAGIAAPGAGMRGWCSSTSAVIFGQLINGMARLSKATGSSALKQKAIALFEGWRETLPDDGNARMRLYDWDKLVRGLVDLQKYAGCDTLPILRKTTEWAARTFDRSRRPADAHDFWGAGPGDTSEWYTLPENLYRAYQISGEALFRDFGDVWLYDAFWRQFAETADPTSVLPVHAYSHVNSFSSEAMAYAVTGDRRNLEICINGYDFLQRTQCYATGGYGPDERLMPPDGSLGRSLNVNGFRAEIPWRLLGSVQTVALSHEIYRRSAVWRLDQDDPPERDGRKLANEPDGRTFYYGDYGISAGRKSFYW